MLRKSKGGTPLPPPACDLLVFVVAAGVAVGFGAGQFFQQVGVLDRRGDLIVPAGPFAQVEYPAAVGAEGEVLTGGEDDFAAGGAEERFRGSHNVRIDAVESDLFRRFDHPGVWARLPDPGNIYRLCAKFCRVVVNSLVNNHFVLSMYFQGR